jgi:hypothetical protein
MHDSNHTMMPIHQIRHTSQSEDRNIFFNQIGLALLGVAVHRRAIQGTLFS